MTEKIFQLAIYFVQLAASNERKSGGACLHEGNLHVFLSDVSWNDISSFLEVTLLLERWCMIGHEGRGITRGEDSIVNRAASRISKHPVVSWRIFFEERERERDEKKHSYAVVHYITDIVFVRAPPCVNVLFLFLGGVYREAWEKVWGSTLLYSRLHYGVARVVQH